jgi:hypothetical protein
MGFIARPFYDNHFLFSEKVVLGGFLWKLLLHLAKALFFGSYLSFYQRSPMHTQHYRNQICG